MLSQAHRLSCTPFFKNYYLIIMGVSETLLPSTSFLSWCLKKCTLLITQLFFNGFYLVIQNNLYKILTITENKSFTCSRNDKSSVPLLLYKFRTLDISLKIGRFLHFNDWSVWERSRLFIGSWIFLLKTWNHRKYNGWLICRY